MNKRESVVIRPAANGYVVEPLEIDPAMRRSTETVMVFESMERLTAWVAVHFSKAEMVKAPESVKAGKPACEHVWQWSAIGLDKYCTRCGEREAAHAEKEPECDHLWAYTSADGNPHCFKCGVKWVGK